MNSDRGLSVELFCCLQSALEESLLALKEFAFPGYKLLYKTQATAILYTIQTTDARSIHVATEQILMALPVVEKVVSPCLPSSPFGQRGPRTRVARFFLLAKARAISPANEKFPRECYCYFCLVVCS